MMSFYVHLLMSFKKNPMKASFNLTSLMTFLKDLRSQVHVVYHLLIQCGFNYSK